MDFTIVAQAGLTQEEFAALIGVSRVTANTWITQGKEPNRFVQEKVRKVLRALSVACTYNLLPLQGVRRVDREAAIPQALKGALLRFASENKPTHD